MVVSISSYCQYPAVKVIGKDSVVVMTIKQGQDINQKFMDLTSEIQTLKDSISKKNSEVISLKSDNNTLNSSLNLVTVKSNGLEENNNKLKILIEDNEKSHLSERRKWAGWMFFSFVVTVMLGALK
jgi:septal ring factor EnvC (AmiA/AmiB activator)